MNGRTLAVPAVFTAFLLAGAAPAQALTVHVRLFAGVVRSEGGAALASLQARVRDAEGHLKAWVMGTAGGDGSAWLRLPQDVLLMPGDSVQFWEGPSSYETGPLPRIILTEVSPGTDVVAGRVTPRIADVLIHAEGERLTPSGRVPFEVDATVPTRPDGTFHADLTGLGDLRRRDVIYAGYLEGVFAVYGFATAPGLVVFSGTNYAVLGGKFGSSHEVRLQRRSGRVKARTVTHIGEFLGGEAFVEFHRASGAPVTIRSRDRIVVSGPWSFTDVVDPLSLQVDIAADTFAVQARPGAIVELIHDGISLVRTADASGAILVDWAAALGRDVQPFDHCEAYYQDRAGNEVRVVKEAIAP